MLIADDLQTQSYHHQIVVIEIPNLFSRYKWFEELGLKWYALPAVSSLLLNCGGVEFSACPFNGWQVTVVVDLLSLFCTGKYL